MSSYWKCGKDLPEGQVECEYGCGQDAAVAHEPVLMMTLGIKPRPEVLSNPELKAQFDACLQVWLEAIGRNFIQSGLAGMCEKPPTL